MNETVARNRFRALESLPMRPVGTPRAFFKGSWASLQAIVGQHQLIGQLVKRELRTRYRASFGGLLWSLARPLAMLLVYYFFVGQVLGAARSIPFFAVYMFTGYITWTLFSETVSRATVSLIGNAGLVRKVSLPREVFPLSTSVVALVNFGIQVGLLIVFELIVRGPFNAENIGIGILSILLIFVFSLALGLFLAAATVFFHDLEHLVEVVLMFLFWGSPVLYSVELVKSLIHNDVIMQIYLANPITVAILGMQSVFWGAASTQDPGSVLLRVGIGLIVSLILLWVAQRTFNRVQGSFAQVL